MGDVVARYELEELPARYSTRRGYQQLHRLYVVPRWGTVPLVDMDALEVRAWIDGLALASRTKGHIHGQMRVLYKFAMLWKWAPTGTNIMSLFSIRGATKRQRRPRVISPEQWHLLVRYFSRDLRMQTLVISAYLLGLRSSELFALKWSDFDHHAGKLRITRSIVDGFVADTNKTEASTAPMPLGPYLSEVFLRWRQATPFKSDEDWVFASEWLNGVTPIRSQHQQVKKLAPAGRAIGLEFSLGWHTFRHSCKVLLERAGQDVTVQRDYMRHSDTHTTMQVYGDVEFDRMQAAHERVVALALKGFA